MFDIWQTRAAQQVQGVAEIAEVDVPKVTGVTQLNSYYQSVLGSPLPAVTQSGSNAVSVAGELNAYLGAGGATDIGIERFPTSRSAVGRVASCSADEAAAVDADVQLSGLLSATSPVRALAENGQWEALAAWKVAPQGRAAEGVSARELIADRAVTGDLSRYAAAFQSQVAPLSSTPPPPRVTSREVAAFMDHADYSHSPDGRTAAGERSEDLPSRQVADLIGGFTPLSEA